MVLKVSERIFYGKLRDKQTTEYDQGMHAILCDETMRANNNYGGGNVIVTIPGDIDGDYYVGSSDAGILKGCYGTWRGDPLYIPEADFDCDGYIGSASAGILNGNYGKTAV